VAHSHSLLLLYAVPGIPKTVTDSLHISDAASKSIAMYLVFKTTIDSLQISDAVSKGVAVFKTVVDSLGIIDVVSKGVVIFKVVADTLHITDVAVRIYTIMKTVFETLKIWDRAGQWTTPPCFGEYALPHVISCGSSDDSIFQETLLPSMSVAYRKIRGSIGTVVEVSGWVEDSGKAALEAMAHKKRYLVDVFNRPILCLMLKPELTRSVAQPERHDYRISFMALERNFPAASLGDTSSTVFFGAFGFPHVQDIVLSDTSLKYDRPIPGAQIGKRGEIGATGRTVAVSGWMEYDYRDAMDSLADDVVRTYTDGKNSFAAKMLKPRYSWNVSQPGRIDYDTTLVEVISE